MQASKYNLESISNNQWKVGNYINTHLLKNLVMLGIVIQDKNSCICAYGLIIELQWSCILGKYQG